MYLGLFVIVGGLLLLMGMERIYPDRKLPEVSNWWPRVIAINLAQLVIVVLGSYTWEAWSYSFSSENSSIFVLQDYVNPLLGGFIAYLTNTFIFYFFHRARHEIYLFWVLFHQVHHSAQRIEAITSFYKHPLEIMIDSVLMAILLYPILGLSKESSIWLSFFSAFGEYFYHMNIKTPHWIGYFFQRPESHRIHHLRNKRRNCKNYSDLPLWDILGGTFENPQTDIVSSGFDEKNETRLPEMLIFRDVLNKNKKQEVSISYCVSTVLALGLLIVGLLQPLGYLFNQPELRGLGLVTAASPLPLVFSAYNGVETYSTSFNISILTDKNQKYEIPLTKKLYAEIQGPYNRRNVFGVLFSHGPFFNNPKLISLRTQILRYAICDDGLNLRKNLPIKFDERIKEAEILVTSQSTSLFWSMKVDCRFLPMIVI